MNPTYYQYQLGASAGFQQVPAGYTTTQYIGAPQMAVGRVQVSLQPPPPPPPVSFAQYSHADAVSTATSSAQDNSGGKATTVATCVSISPSSSVASSSQSSTAAAVMANETKTVYSQSGSMITPGTTNVMQTGQLMMPPTAQQQSSQLISGVYAGAYIQQAVQQHAAPLSYPPQPQQHMFAAAASQYAAAPKVMYLPSHHGGGLGKQQQPGSASTAGAATSYFLPTAAVQPSTTLVTDPNTGKTYLLSGASQMPAQYQFQTVPGKHGMPGQQYLVAAPQQYHAFPAAGASGAFHSHQAHHYAYATTGGSLVGRNPGAAVAAGHAQVPLASYAPAHASAGAMSAAPQVYPYM